MGGEHRFRLPKHQWQPVATATGAASVCWCSALPFWVRDKVKIYQFKLFCGRGSSLSNSSPPSCSTGTKQAQCSKGVYLNLSVVWMGLWFYAMLWKWRVRSIFRFWKLFITVLHIRLQKLESLHQTFIQTHTHPQTPRTHAYLVGYALPRPWATECKRFLSSVFCAIFGNNLKGCRWK